MLFSPKQNIGILYGDGKFFFAVTSYFSPVSLILLVASDHFFCYYFKCSYAMGAALRIGRIINYIDRSTKHSLSL